MEDLEIDVMIIFKIFLIVIRWTTLKLICLMMGFCENGNEFLSFMKKNKLLAEGCNKFVKPCRGLFVSAKYTSMQGQVLATDVREKQC